MTRRPGRPARRVAGFTLIEVVVACCLFAIGAAALAETLVIAQRVRASSARWLHALALAEERLERLRAGERSEDGTAIGPYTRTWHATASAHDPALEEIEVQVEWDDRGRQRLTLTTLQRRRP